MRLIPSAIMASSIVLPLSMFVLPTQTEAASTVKAGNSSTQRKQTSAKAKKPAIPPPAQSVKNGEPTTTSKPSPNTNKDAAISSGQSNSVHSGKNPVDAFELPEVTVIGNTPLGTTGLEMKKIPGNVQTVEDEEIHRHEAFDLPDFMNRRLESVNLNDVQNNPYQPDITYRGFTASPLLGTPIGISAYQDGVRVNEAFGDTLNWDLIPQVAIANMEMVPGSNPLFGLNTLGGALSIRTKSGNSHPGYQAQAYGGSYGRQGYQAEIGGSKGEFDWYFAGNLFYESGWRPFSATAVNQAFGKVGWENESTDVDLSLTFADNTMNGVGPAPDYWLQDNWRAIYTAPDSTQNTMYFVTLKGSHKITDDLQLTANAYNRNLSNTHINSNTNEHCAQWVSGTECLNDEGEADIPGSLVNAITRTNGTGINLQMTSNYKIVKFDNQFVVGGGYNYGNTNFSVSDQAAIIFPDQYQIAVSPLTTNVDINGKNEYGNVFATDTFSVFDWLHLNASLNWIHANVKTSDKIGTALNGNNTFSRVNPSAGFTLNPLDALSLDTPVKEFTTYFNYNEGFRAPTAVELSCADPKAPCSLPSSFVSDPPLNAVISHTLEAGLRGKLNEMLKWNFALYQTRNSDDILFLNSPGSVVNGYFQNVGTTQRQGIELGLGGLALDTLNWYLSYGFVDATYQTTAVLGNALGSQLVTPGDRIPTIPQNTLKFGAEYEILKGWFFGGDLQYVSSQFARGDDENIYPQVPDYTVVNLNTRYKINQNFELFAMGRNIFDQRYASYGQVGENMYLNNQPSMFRGPGIPATGYAGVRVHWD